MPLVHTCVKGITPKKFGSHRIRLRDSFNYSLKATDPEVLSKPKRGYERRDLHITHPIPQLLLAHEISAGWRSISKWLSHPTYSVDKIRISKHYERALKGINFSIHSEKKKYIKSMSNWTVKTDITRFYPSIYTHSIAWAAYGKERVKSAIPTYSGSLADRLDLLVRSCNRNQTIGIPIGPETSRVIAEVISTRIDRSSQTIIAPYTDQSLTDRLQDDWMIGADSFEDAEHLITRISQLYKDFGLDINGNKTSIEHISRNLEEPWVSEISAFLSHAKRSLAGKALNAFLELTLTLQSKHINSPIVNYSLSVLESTRINREDVKTIEMFLMQCLLLSPISTDRISRILLDLNHSTKAISVKRVTERIIKILEINLKKELHFEIIWLLYLLRGLNSPINSRYLLEFAEYTKSSSIQLLILDMKHRGSIKGRLPIDSWENQLTDEQTLTSSNWLLAYEGIRHGWLADPNRLMDKPFFKSMASRGDIFYDEARNIKPIRYDLKARGRRVRSDRIELMKFLSELRAVSAFE